MSPAAEAQAQEAMEAEQQQQKLQQLKQQRYLEKGVLLEPFVHQVGGHSCVLRFGEQTICKPLIPREHQFYKSLPAAMRNFTPQYRGEVSVSFDEDEEGNLCLIAYPLRSDTGEQENKDPAADGESWGKLLQWANKMPPTLLRDDNYTQDGRARRPRKDEDERREEEEEEMEVEWQPHTEVEGSGGSSSGGSSSNSSASTPHLKHNPWSLKCQQQHLQRMKENAKHRNQYKFILLENLTWRHAMPCVLDLKMGTRQHGDDASEEKKALQIRKCQQSTSASIGVRLCGMQVYQSDSGQQMFMSKYHGRKLSLQGFKEALFQFFHDGRRLRRELLSPVLRRLQEMQSALEGCESYRFYSSSLLIIYDGRPRRRRRTEDGLSEEEEEEEEEEVEEEEEDEQAGAFGFSHGSTALSCGGNTGDGGAAAARCPPRSEPSGPTVDVRMIDFAHTTCRHYGEDSVVHEGQDRGYIFGLQNLITIISQLEDHSTD